ncbi:atlastin-1-like isoform X2 [Dermacentor andersoni]|uniref:atlastin-1-like isoform X2 n=1 Tax=Dermacentor andersoni TaxID=34620 RepID=UPI003B3B4C19
MCDRDSGGQPLRILDVDGRGLVLDEHALARVLLADHVKDKPVVVIAIAGVFRKGKSFLLCFLLRYLRNLGRADWLGDPNAPLDGFEWRGGSDRHTKGIVIWSEAFLVKTSRGEELAVLLMDTQGTFDCESSNEIHRDIFALSAMISSVLVYNVSQNIQENYLQHLQDFIEYGVLLKSAQRQHQSASAVQGEGSMRPFQSLWFLVRDWMSPSEIEYGAKGGRKLLDKRLTIAPGQDEDLRRLREKIRSCFKTIRSFLMPFPGEKVTEVASIRAAMEIALDFYTTSMLKVWQGPGDVTREIMQGHHYRLREEAFERYRVTPKMGGKELALLYSQKLEEKIDIAFEFFCEYLKEKSTVFDSVVFKVVHGVVTAGLAVGAIALAVVELPIVAAGLAAAGAASLTGHIIHTIVDLTLAKRKRMARQNNASRAAGTANSSKTYDDDSDDEDTQEELEEHFQNFTNEKREK